MTAGAARAFDALVTEFYDVWFRFHPIEALQAGVSGYEGGHPAADDDDVGALVAWLEATIVGLEELDYHALDDDRQLDMELLFCACREEHQSMLERDWRHRDPLGFLPFLAIHQLVTTPWVRIEGALERCISGVPEHLRHARNQLSTFPQLIPRQWLQTAILEAEAGARYLRKLPERPQITVQSQNPAEIMVLCYRAVESVVAFVEYLKRDIGERATGAVACGSERFIQRLHLRHGLTCPSDALQRRVEREYRETEAELSRLSLAASGSGDPSLWLERLARGKGVKEEDALCTAREQSQALRVYLTDQGLVRIPQAARLKILSPPDCLDPDRCPPTYRPPEPGDPDLEGTLYLSPGLAGSGHRLREQLIADCIRCGWSGSHLQAVTAATSSPAGTLVRRLNPSSSMVRGWPMYVEQLLHDQGYCATPEQSLIRLTGRLRWLLLARLDLEIHIQGLDPEAAQARLASLPGVSSPQTEFDFLELTRNPTEYLAGVIGWCLISELRRLLFADPAKPEQRDFHAALLDQGGVAVALIIRRIFGDDVWSTLLQRLELAD